MRGALALAFALLASSAVAQQIQPSAYTDAQAQAANASAIAAVAATVPTPSATIAPQPANGGVVGTPGTYMPGGVAPKLIVQSANVTLGTDCTWSVTFAQPFNSATPNITATAVISPSATQPEPCQVTARSTTTQSGKCFQGQTTLLSLSIVTAGVTVNPFNSTSCTAVPVMVYGRDPTQ